MRLAFLGARGFLLALAFSGCKKSEPTDATSGAAVTASVQATASAAPAPAGPRADDMQLPTLPPVPIPPDNPMSDAKTKLGQALFFDKRLSVDGSRACYSCHLNEDGTGGHDPIAVGAGDKVQKRHAPALWNLGYHKSGFYWDGRAAQLEDVAKGAWGGGNMGVGKDNLEKKTAE